LFAKKVLNRPYKSEGETGAAGGQLVSNKIYRIKARAGSFASGFLIGCILQWL